MSLRLAATSSGQITVEQQTDVCRRLEQQCKQLDGVLLSVSFADRDGSELAKARGPSSSTFPYRLYDVSSFDESEEISFPLEIMTSVLGVVMAAGTSKTQVHVSSSALHELGSDGILNIGTRRWQPLEIDAQLKRCGSNLSLVLHRRPRRSVAQSCPPMPKNLQDIHECGSGTHHDLWGAEMAPGRNHVHDFGSYSGSQRRLVGWSRRGL